MSGKKIIIILQVDKGKRYNTENKNKEKIYFDGT